MNLDHSFVEQVLQQLACALIGWLISLPVRALRRRILGRSSAAAGRPAFVVVLVAMTVNGVERQAAGPPISRSAIPCGSPELMPSSSDPLRAQLSRLCYSAMVD
jgi:hypothetical protein